MTRDDCITYIILSLWDDCGVIIDPEEEPIFILKLLTMIEQVEQRAQRELREAMRLQTTLN